MKKISKRMYRIVKDARSSSTTELVLMCLYLSVFGTLVLTGVWSLIR